MKFNKMNFELNNKPKITKLEDIKSDEVSLVERGANRFSYLLIKSEDNYRKDKANEDEGLIMGIVMVPGVEDKHGDIPTFKAVRDSAHNFMIKNKNEKSLSLLGVDHKKSSCNIELVESFIAPCDIFVKNRYIKNGSWVITVKVLDKTIWNKVKVGKLEGFSIEGIGYGYKL